MNDKIERLMREIIWPITTEISSRIMQAMDPDASKPYYHYTSADGLKSIIETGTLYAGSIKYSNDAVEYQHGSDAILKSLVDAIDTCTGSAPVIEQIRNKFATDSGQNIFACCFSELSDDLEQWRGYGAGGFGYAIGLDLRGLVATNALELSALGHKFNWEVLKVLYSTDGVRSAIVVPLIEKLNSVSLPDDEIAIVASFLGVGIGRYSPIFKHAAFAHEQEVRLVAEIKNSSDFEFRIKNSVLYPFAKLRLGSGRLPITDIVIGPCLPNGQASPSLTMFLAKHGYESVAVRQSDVPYLP